MQGLTLGVTSVIIGNGQGCAAVDGRATCWGSNSNGQLGNNATTNSPTPVQVDAFTTGASVVSGSVMTSCALANGSVYCWGSNLSGELGNGSAATQSLVPMKLATP